MKVLFIHHGADLYGASKCLLRLSTRLAKDGNNVSVLMPEDGPLGSALKESGVQIIIDKTLPVIERKKLKSLTGILLFLASIPRSIIRTFKIISKIEPDIIHTNLSIVFTGGIIAKIKKIPHVWHIRETYVEFPSFFRLYQLFIYLSSDKIVCISNSVASNFSEFIKEKKILVIHDGYPKEEFNPVQSDRIEAFRKEYGLADDMAVGVVGRIKLLRKGQEVFLKAAAQLKDKFPNVKFLLIGSPFPGNEDHLETLLELADSLNIRNRIVYTSDVCDINAAYASLDISVMSSALPEPLGGVTIESMALCKPMVGTNIGGTVEIIENNETGYLVEPNNPEEMATALESLLLDENLRVEMGLKGRERFLKLFEFEESYRKIVLLYNCLTSNLD